MTCIQLHKRAEKIGSLLMEKGRLNTGDHVALLFPPGLELIAAFYGCLYVGMSQICFSLFYERFWIFFIPPDIFTLVCMLHLICPIPSRMKNTFLSLHPLSSLMTCRYVWYKNGVKLKETFSHTMTWARASVCHIDTFQVLLHF